MQNNRLVIGFGEALLDIIIEPSGSVTLMAGGSVLNTLVSLSRSQISTQIITSYGSDIPGRIIEKFLEQEHIGRQFVSVFQNGKTALAFAELDANKNAAYCFYKDYPANLSWPQVPVFTPETIFAFGSFSAIQENLQAELSSLIQLAVHANSIIFYDPNIRSKKIEKHSSAYRSLKNNLSLAHIIRGSDEDFLTIFGTENASKIFELIQSDVCELLVVTSAGNGIQVRSKRFHFEMQAPAIEVVSTIGAGDAFNAGMMQALIAMNCKKNDLNCLAKFQFEKLILNGIKFASEVCQSEANYIQNKI